MRHTACVSDLGSLVNQLRIVDGSAVERVKVAGAKLVVGVDIPIVERAVAVLCVHTCKSCACINQ